MSGGEQLESSLNAAMRESIKQLDSDTKLVCPKCKITLSPTVIGFICNSCHDTWRTEQNVIKSPDFDDNQYWGEIPRTQMTHILWRAKMLGAARAFEEWAQMNNNSYMERYVLDWRRAALIFELVNLPDHAVILDYGCGYGTLGLSVARTAETIYLADSTAERIEFAALRGKESGMNNIVALGIQNWRDLPIAPQSVDLIIVNGVLEWIPTTGDGKPLEVQKEFISRLSEYLRPNGTLYIGIENRYALRYFAGYPDDHTGLYFTSIMPRWLAEIYCKLRQGKSYRTITWSLGEHKKYFTSLGFDCPMIYCMFPDYRFPEAVCRIDDFIALEKIHSQLAKGKSLSQRLRKKILALISTIGLWPWLVYSYGVVATKRT
jgi:2-polyprenyl-3-methyl-5-hydroxy-6-metoxy-1,4-benzoquinol methylase